MFFDLHFTYLNITYILSEIFPFWNGIQRPNQQVLPPHFPSSCLSKQSSVGGKKTRRRKNMSANTFTLKTFPQKYHWHVIWYEYSLNFWINDDISSNSILIRKTILYKTRGFLCPTLKITLRFRNWAQFMIVII